MWLRFSLTRLGRFLGLDNLSVDVSGSDDFTRFLVHKGHLRRNGVHLSGLLPKYNEQKNRWETSSHRTGGLRSEQIWLFGYLYVESEGRHIRARGIGVVSSVTDLGFGFEVNGKPYPRHADIIGWHDEKHQRQMKALELANRMQREMDPR